MRDDNGFEVLAVTHREQLETVGNVERFALSWRVGYWHETPVREVHRCDNARPAAVRYYRATETPAGPRLAHTETADAVAVRLSFHPNDVNQDATARTETLPKQRDTWQLRSVHAASQKNFNITSEVRSLSVMVTCAACGARRGFASRIWLDPTLTLGCHRCMKRALDPHHDTTPTYTSAADVPAAHGLFRLDRVTMGKTKECVVIVWATCTGPHCGGYQTSFTPPKWADATIRLSCNKCCRTRISAEQRITIKQRLDHGETVGKLWREYHVHKTTVQKLLTELRMEQRAAVLARAAEFKAVIDNELWRVEEEVA